MPFEFTNSARYRFRKGGFFLGLDDDGNETGVMLERHGVMIGGARSGKGAAVLIPNARRWHGTLLNIDPKGENVEKTYQERQAMGQAVYALDPYHAANIPPDLRAAFNPLAAIDPSSRSARAQVQAIGNGLIVSHNAEHAEWTNTAREMLAGICGYVIASYPPELRTFRTVRALLNQPDQLTDAAGEPLLDGNGEPQGLYITAQRMLDCIAFGGIVRSAANQIMRGITAEKSVEQGALGQAQRSTSWLDDEPIAETLDRSTFSLSDLKTGKASVYLVIPPEHLKTSSAYLRLFVQCAIQAMATGGQKGSPCLFLLDEFFALGKLDDVETAVGLLPSYGVHLVPFLQNLGQLQKLYGRDGATTFLTNADAVIFFGNSGDDMALEYISRRIGPLTPDEITQAPPKPVPFVPLPQPTPTPFQATGQPQTRAYNGWEDQKIWKSDDESREILRADQENAMRQWQVGNSRAEALHRAAEDAKMREWATANAKALEEHNARQRARQAVYDHHMRQVNQPRLTPAEIEKLTSKPDGAQVALSMIVFAKAGDILNLHLAPYFRAFAVAGPKLTTGRPPLQYDPEPALDPAPPTPPKPAPAPAPAPAGEPIMWPNIGAALLSPFQWIGDALYGNYDERAGGIALLIVMFARAAAVFTLSHFVPLALPVGLLWIGFMESRIINDDLRLTWKPYYNDGLASDIRRGLYALVMWPLVASVPVLTTGTVYYRLRGADWLEGLQIAATALPLVIAPIALVVAVWMCNAVFAPRQPKVGGKTP